ncbi:MULTISPECIES: transaldolase [unclassified Roseateles]|uniref:transaldolase n=1 Tax=unclassified Roseateles TaxID=2626991 RepID=UPI0006FF098A|nr:MULTISPECIES: transaldolase [unclassified Roseateles]KQW46224.1 transaldolase [Pelomonas sp. Root405]KRA73273.1 transaldolase [Pelomonas sp. Root662]
MNSLDQLRQHSTVVADTGDFDQLARFSPQDATTNPSLVLKAVQQPRYRPLLEQAVAAHRGAPASTVAEHLLVAFGVEILKLVPGRVSTEIDPRLSHDTAVSVATARRLIALYAAAGVPRARVLIKLASTWQGIQAARELEAQGIHTNLTLLFCLAQARACADAGVQLISPFVGRIYDWFKKTAGGSWDEAAMAGPNDPGVRSVEEIYRHYKRHGIRTEVMAASFRNSGQIVALAGCDLMTISPALLGELAQATTPVTCRLTPPAGEVTPPPPPLTQAAFEAALAADAMARDKLAEGIAQFIADTETLEQLIHASQA